MAAAAAGGGGMASSSSSRLIVSCSSSSSSMRPSPMMAHHPHPPAAAAAAVGVSFYHLNHHHHHSFSSSSCRRGRLSWSSRIANPNLLLPLPLPSSSSISNSNHRTQGFVVHAAWTRRSRSEAAKRPSRKSWKQRTDMYLRPFLLNVFFSKRFIHAKVMHRGTSKVISVATTNAKDLRNTLPSLTDTNACRVIGKLIAERSKEADVFAIAFEAKKNERIEGRLGIVLDTIKENGIIFV